jgi:hypothetical protein
MYHLNQVVSGIQSYVDSEIIQKINGWQRWIIATGISLMLEKSSNIFNSLKSNELVKMLELIDDDDRIDVDTIYRELKKQAERGAITLDLPMLGAVTFTSTDVDRLYSLIQRG